ncbi:hypothetical protein [Bradyrhizobium symbiodeficiens]|uniref:hypothetical protein n=1 Tax=Bradyrhizobium symbiodeficiens TaxID=1404367 RepID=UPI00140F9443|nr:hypothetical protein [Bradyrhizobium symbiodeficiens]QIP01286.1 hypothetical protein HAU86_16505 [Bradyrhizobium symbiodeficiens]
MTYALYLGKLHGKAVSMHRCRPTIGRHTLGRWMRAKGVPKWEVQGQVGHGKGVTELYAEFDPAIPETGYCRH